MIEKIDEIYFNDNLTMYSEYDDNLNYEFFFRKYLVKNS